MPEQLVRIITHRQRLDGLYGDGYFDTLLEAIANWEAALAAEGMIIETPFVLCDDLPDGDVARAIKARLARLNRRPADAVVILGGPDIVPLFPVCSAEFLAPLDGDTQILSDDPYVAFDCCNALYKPECPVGRLPDGGPGAPGLLIDLLARAAAYHRHGAASTPSLVGLTEAAWYDVSRHAFDFPNSLYACPPYSLPRDACASEQITSAWLQLYNVQYYNVCGAPPNTMWYAQCDVKGCAQACDDLYVPVLDALTIPTLSDGWIFSEASYSASIAPLAKDNLAMQFLKQGAAGYIGATATAYGALQASSLQAADWLGRAFMEGVRQNMLGHTRLSVGEILRRAKLGYQVRDNFDRKTLVEFLLLGDPTLIPFQR